MEAVPRLPMIGFELKESVNDVNFKTIKEYIAYFYKEDEESYNTQIQQLIELRAMACRPSNDVAGCSTMKKYYCQLHFLLSRFPLEEKGELSIKFVWKDPYTDTNTSAYDINLEMASILYNIGALHTQLGAADARTTADGMKMACTHFQCAAWAFQRITEKFPQNVESDLPLFMNQLCLAQAQECILEKSMLDNRKASSIAKVAVQTVEYYKQCLKLLNAKSADNTPLSKTILPKVAKTWEKYIKFKIAYHGCIGFLYQGQQSEEQRQMGERVAYYQVALEKLEEARKLTKGLNDIDAINEALQFTNDVVEGKKKAAKNENEFVYHEEVPAPNLLAEVKGASLVKGIPFSVNDLDVSGPDIFAALVPMKAHVASSTYSEILAQILRDTTASVLTSDQELASFLSTLQLEELHATDEWRLPQDLVDRCAALGFKPTAIQDLMDSMDALTDTFQDVNGMLVEIQELLQKEEEAARDYEEIVGKRPPSITATDLKWEANKYQDAHNKASESNQALHKTMTLHIQNLRVLSLPLQEIYSRMPAVTLDAPEDEAAVKNMQILMNKVKEMKTQREMLVEQLREAIKNDDITHQIVTYTGNHVQEIFEAEKKKHQKQIDLIELNMKAQFNIIAAIKDAYPRYSNSRRHIADKIQQREALVANLKMSYDAYEDLIDKSKRGLDFYHQLQSYVNKLLLRVRSACKVQEEEREQVLANISDNLPRNNSGSKTPSLNNKSVVNQASSRTPVDLKRNNLEPTPSEGLKLKDYLNMKKETGKMSLISGPSYGSGYIPPTTTKYDSWIPEVRPAPVGSEENEPPISKLSYLDSSKTLETNGKSTAFTYRQPDSQYYPYGGQLKQLPEQNYVADYSSYYVGGYQPMVQNYPATVYPNSTDPSADQTMSQAMGPYIPQIPNSVSTQPGPAMPPNQPPPNDYSLPPQLSQGSATDYSASSFNYAPASNYNPEPVLPTNYPAQAYPTGTYAGNSANQTFTNMNQTYLTSNTMGQGITSYPPTAREPQMVAYGLSHNPTTYVTPPFYNASGLESIPYNSVASSAASALSNQLDPTYPLPQPPAPVTPQGFPAVMPGHVPSNIINSSVPAPPQVAPAVAPGPSNVNPATPAAQVVPPLTPQQIPLNYNPAISSALQGDTLPFITSHVASNTTPIAKVVTYGGETYSRKENYNYENYPYNSPNVAIPYSTGSQQQQQNYYSSNTTNNADVNNVYLSYGTQNNIYTSTVSSSLQQVQNSVSEGYTSYTPEQASGYGQAASYLQTGNTSLYTQTPQTYDYTTTTSENYNSVPKSLDIKSDPFIQPTQGPYDSFIPHPGGNSSTQSPVTYRQAGFENVNAACSTTPSATNNSQSSPSVKPSNLDLLAGIDLNIKQPPPLVPAAAITSPEKATSTPSAVILQADIEPVDAKKAPKEEVKPLTSDVLQAFVPEVEKFSEFVGTLTTKTLNGPTSLDLKWKAINDAQEKDSLLRSISVARCYPMKNRFPHILPYDDSRIQLPSTKDDYINASAVKPLTNSMPPLILTQAPLPITYMEFWTMVLEQHAEVVICLLGDAELEGHVYWPTEKGVDMELGRLRVSLQTCNAKQHWTERILQLTSMDTKTSRLIVHLQLTAWPGSSMPVSPGPFLQFVQETCNFFSQQRNGSHPAVVHCLSGIGRSGLFALVATSIFDIQREAVIPDLVKITSHISQFRKNCLRDKEHLKFAYQAVLYFCQDLLLRRGILTKFEGKKSHTRHPSEDFVIAPEIDQLRSKLENTELDPRSKDNRSSCNSSMASSGRNSPSQFGATKQRFTSENFIKPAGTISTPASSSTNDPFNELDPMWSMKK